MPIKVSNEIGKLKKVMLHRPGRELEHLSPGTMEELLFDDIPYLHAAQREHDQFAQILRDNGTEVLYLEDLMTETLDGDNKLKYSFIEEFVNQAGDTAMGYRYALKEYLRSIRDTRELVRKTMEGIPFSEADTGITGSLTDLAGTSSRFIAPPMPNLYFARDPFACVAGGVSLNHMHTDTRNRETIFGRYIFRHHPLYADTHIYYTPYEYFSIEGGDIQVLSERLIMVGISQRTQAEAIEELAKNIFADESCAIDTVLAAEIPRSRAFMHLDTVLTQVDRDKFTVHPGILQGLRVFELTGKGEKNVKVRELDAPLEQILAGYLGLDRVTLIRCGGGSIIAAEREQWNDGSNTLCIRPGTVIVYDRNYVTNQALRDNGIEVIEMRGSELSRGRGGPRCMSMPFERDTL